jgi:hypothetical protein
VDTGTRIALLYNVFGSRIVEVGALGAPDVFEQPFHQLDLVFSQKVGKRWSLNLKAKNLLNYPIRILQGDKLTSTFTKGLSISAGASYSF